ncbi:MAG TPA: Lrp/AsnC family transcriptional regulator [Allosphingosinicella sp.]|jgi:DNA-binding Lrp family transcriptional regulator
MRLDDFDGKMLACLQRDADVTAERLAQAVGLSASAVQRRLTRLKAQRVISSTVAIVDPQSVGRPSFFIVGLEIERERPELLSALKAWPAAEEAVQQVFYVTGSWDYMLVVTARDVTAYDRFMSRLLSENPNVRRFSTNVALAYSSADFSSPSKMIDDEARSRSPRASAVGPRTRPATATGSARSASAEPPIRKLKD